MDVNKVTTDKIIREGRFSRAFRTYKDDGTPEYDVLIYNLDGDDYYISLKICLLLSKVSDRAIIDNAVVSYRAKDAY